MKSFSELSDRALCGRVGWGMKATARLIDAHFRGLTPRDFFTAAILIIIFF